MTRFLTIAAIGAALLLVAGCGDDDDSDDSASTTTETTEAATGAATETTAAAGTTIKAGDSQFGQVLFDADDQAIYYFDKESGAKSECYGACAEAWPPVLSEGEPQAGGGAKQALLGITERD